MTVTSSERKKQILNYVNEKPYCSMDSVFTEGHIPKSKATKNIFNHLVSEKKIQIRQIKSGKSRYFINGGNWDMKTKWVALDFEINKFKGIINQIKEQTPFLTLICEHFSKLLDLRIKITRLEHKYAEKLNKNFNGNGLMWILNKFQKFHNKFISEPSTQKINDFMKWVESEISRDTYYLEHHLNSVVARSLTDKIGILKDRREYGLTRQTQIHHEMSLKSKNLQPENVYDEIFKRLDAERDRVLCSNPKTISNEIMRNVCLKRLEIIKPKRSKRYNSERKILKDTIRQLDENPTLLHDMQKEKEEQD